MNKLKYLSVLAAGIVLAFSQNASAVTVNTVDYGVATIQPTVIPPSGMNINNLIFAVNAYNTQTPQNDGTYTYDPLQGTQVPNPAPIPTSLNDEVVQGGTSFNIDLGAGGFDYLIVQWDGPEGGNAVYYLGGLSGIITVTNDIFFNGNNQPYAASGYWLSGGGAGVPDGGTTVMLLGAALGALGMARRYLFS
jgi:hypothetical protein